MKPEFKVGDKVWTIDEDGGVYGYGCTVIGPFVVADIESLKKFFIYITDDYYEGDYCHDVEGSYIYDYDAYASEEEAQAECDRINRMKR